MLGLLVAFLGVALSDYLKIPMLDGVASIAIGCILGLTAVLLAYESKGLLIGEAASPALVAGVKSIVQNKQGIERVNELLTMHMGPQDVRAACKTLIGSERRKNTQTSSDFGARQLARF